MNNTLPLDSFFGPAQETTKDAVRKGWSEDWLKMKESNLLELGSNKITSPYSQSHAVYRAVRSIAENLPQAVFRIYQNDKEVPLNHPISKLFNKPNPMSSRWELWESVATFLNLRGEAFIYMNKSLGQSIGSTSIPAELWSLNPQLIEHTLSNGQLVSWIFNKKMPIASSEMIHIKFFNPNNPVRGQSPISAIQSEMESDYAAGKYNKAFFDNGANPDGVVSVSSDKEVSIEELRKLKRLWNENHQGSAGAHKTAFLLGGMSYSQMGISQRDMDFLAGREFSRTAILATFGVPSFVAGFNNKGEVNRSTAVASKNIFWSNTLTPQLMRIQEKMFSDFFMPYAPEYSGKFDLSGIPELRPDLTESMTAGKEMFMIGYTRNEINNRLRLDMPSDPDGDVRYLPMNLIASGDSEDADPVMESVSDEDEKSQISNETKISKMADVIIQKVKTGRKENYLKVQAKLESALHSKIKRYVFGVRSESLKVLNDEPDTTIAIDRLSEVLNDSKNKLSKLVEPVFRKIMIQGTNLAYGSLGIERMIHGIEHKAPDENLIDEVVLAQRLNKVTGMTDTVFAQLKASLSDGLEASETIQELSARAKDVFNITSNRSLVIARTESNSLLNGSATSVYKKEGVSMKEWLTTLDSAARESHIEIDGEIVGIDGQFSNGLSYPGDPSGPAEEVVNCRCSISPVVTV